MSGFPERIEAGDFSLRPMVEGDLHTVQRHLNDPDIARWMAAARQPFGPEEAAEILALSGDQSQRIRVIEQDGSMVGCLRLCPDLWFWLDHPARGKGIMGRALELAIAAHFAKTAPPLLASCRDNNHASQVVLSGLGFSRIPTTKRIFFYAEGASKPCHDYVMAPEQWHLIHPPLIRHETLSLRPATQKDAPFLMQMLPRAGYADSDLWPVAERLGEFIETHRYRRPNEALWVIENEDRRVIGMALGNAAEGPLIWRFLDAGDEARHAASLPPHPATASLHQM